MKCVFITAIVSIFDLSYCFSQGDTSILAFEISEEFPHLFALSTTTPEGLHQGLALMPKCTCDVRKVEFARAWRLTQTTIEPISFTVPRAKVS